MKGRRKWPRSKRGAQAPLAPVKPKQLPDDIREKLRRLNQDDDR